MGNNKPSENSSSSSLAPTISELKGWEAAAGISYAWGDHSATRVVGNTVIAQNVYLKKCNCLKPQSGKKIHLLDIGQRSGSDVEVRYPSLAESSAISA